MGRMISIRGSSLQTHSNDEFNGSQEDPPASFSAPFPLLISDEFRTRIPQSYLMKDARNRGMSRFLHVFCFLRLSGFRELNSFCFDDF